MGCFLSTTTSKSHKPKNPDSPIPKANGGAPPPPPPPAVEEETVKEVLSETPIPKPTNTYNNHHQPIRPPDDHLHPLNDQPRIQPTAPIQPNNGSYKNHLHPVAERQRIQPTAAIQPNNGYKNQLHPVAEQPRIQPTAAIKPPEEIVSEVSDLSELYSFGDSLSTVTENFIENDGEVTQRVHRSPAKNVRRKRPPASATGRSPARRPEPSPGKRSQAGQGRNVTPVRRNVGPSNVIRRDAGEASSRRSRSPATRGEVGTRRPVRSTGGQDRRSRTPVARRDGGDGDVAVPETAAAENSLDDPNVSLECFIFL